MATRDYIAGIVLGIQIGLLIDLVIKKTGDSRANTKAAGLNAKDVEAALKDCLDQMIKRSPAYHGSNYCKQ